MNIDMTMFYQAFFEEASDLLADLETQLLHLEETPNDKELLNTIFRCAHSIKGGSATFGFPDITHFTHSLETLLDKLRNGQIQVTPELLQLLLESKDQMKNLIAAAQGEIQSAPDSDPLISRIEAAIGNGSSAFLKPAAPAPAILPEEQQDVCHWLFRFAPGPDVLKQGGDPMLLLSRLLKEEENVDVRCDYSHLPSLKDMDPEVCYLSWEAEFSSKRPENEILELFEFVADDSEVSLTAVAGRFSSSLVPAGGAQSSNTPATSKAPILKQPDSASPPTENTASGLKTETHTIRVATDKVDKLINLVGELIINQSMLNEVILGFTMSKLPRLVEAVGEMERASRELQERVMAVRMMPIKHAFGRFPRLVRDLASVNGKKIDLKTTGEDTELDKSVIEAIGDPLTHLVRNSIDHGLESPEERRAAGKPELGIVSLNAFHEGGSIVIEVSDDGKGLDAERIYKKALERGLLTEGDPIPPDETLYNYIFHPGFSTAKQVTDLSGRGVGMDIVKQAVLGLGGSITLASQPGVGTRFRIRLPLTLAILEGLSLSVGREVYILPLTSIVESIRPKPGDTRMVAGQYEVAMVRGEALPILRLYKYFGAEPVITDPAQGLLVIVENDGRKVAILVDQLIGQSQVVIKSLESNYRKVEGIAGATILGDGRVALIIDVTGLIRGTLAQSLISPCAA